VSGGDPDLCVVRRSGVALRRRPARNPMINLMIKFDA
jgi:hypothetical protein